MNKEVSESKANSNTPKSSRSNEEETNKKFFSYYFYTPAMWVGGIGLVLILLLFGSGAFVSEQVLTCPASSSVPCGNPYYEFGCTSNEYCGKQFISPGEEYVLTQNVLPSWIPTTYTIIVWSLLLRGLFLNYVAYKKGDSN